MRRILEQLLSKYGNRVTVQGADSVCDTRMFLQLVTSKSWQNMERMFPTGGEIPRGQFLFLAPMGVSISNGDFLLSHGRVFIVRRVDDVLVKDEALFRWGLCVEGGGVDPWSTL